MVDNNGGTLRTVAWSEIFPWLVIFRTFWLARSLRVLVLAAAGILLTLVGWAVLGWVFSIFNPDTKQWMRPGDDRPWLAVNEAVNQAVPNRPEMPQLPNPLEADRLARTSWEAFDPFFGAWAHLSQPLWEVRRFDVTLPELACLLLCGLWAVAVWAFFGGAITRIAAVELACDERVGWAAAIRYACSKWLAYFTAPLFPLIGVLLAAVPIWLVGLVLLSWNVGVLLAALTWPLVLLAGLAIALLLLGLVFGWPLMWATISAEGMDSFDGVQRCYHYVFGRPLHYLFYAVIAAVFGWAGWLLVQNVAAGVVWVTYWAASFGCGGDQIAAIMPEAKTPLTGIGGAGAWLIHFCVGCVKLLAVGFVYGYFWTASTAIYFLLRRDVDATEMDEVFLEEEATEPTYGLPPLKTDEAGAPVVTDEVPEVVPDETAQPEKQPDIELPEEE